jgi:hypothetical protein
MKFKKFKRVIKNTMVISGLIFIILVLILTNVKCKDPNDFAPPEDTLIFPPAAPINIQPADSFVYMAIVMPTYLRISWDSTPGAEMYEFELTYNNYNPNVIVASRNFLDMAFLSDIKFGPYFWRVRASSPLWKGGYTDWTTKRMFEVRWLPHPPFLIYPAHGQILTFDSMPVPIQFQWDTVSDEEYYEIELQQDSIIIYNFIATNNYYEYIFADTGSYSWRVRAGSVHWQYKTEWSETRPFQINLR